MNPTTLTPTHNKTTLDACIDTCNRLLEGERSAVETYDKVLEKFGDDPSIATLRRIRDEHLDSVTLLDQNIRQMGGVALRDSGLWGVFANFVQEAANLFGEESAVASLQKGEEKGAGDYEAALEHEHVLPECRLLIDETLLPRIRYHIKSLDRLQQEFSSKTQVQS